MKMRRRFVTLMTVVILSMYLIINFWIRASLDVSLDQSMPRRRGGVNDDFTNHPSDTLVSGMISEAKSNVVFVNKSLEEPAEKIWTLAASWVNGKNVYPSDVDAVSLSTALNALSSRKILYASNSRKGSQLKLRLILDGGQNVIFKPMRYDRNVVINGTPYAGYDRHNGEIAAYYIDMLLGFHMAPLVSGRLINLTRDIIPVATDRLLETFSISKDNNVCFYGRCFFCNKDEPACGRGEILEGAVILWLPTDKHPLESWIHPWARSYSVKKMRWEHDQLYCKTVLATPLYNSTDRLLDIIDTAIFDYIMGNADRHHYETFVDKTNRSKIFHLDNGKSFGNPYIDERTILAPLYQCCRVRLSTWNSITALNNGNRLSSKLHLLMSRDPVFPVLDQNHYKAVDRRLINVIHEIEICIQDAGRDNVLVHPIF